MSSTKSINKHGTVEQPLVRPFAERDRETIRRICSEAAREKPDARFHEDCELAPMWLTDYYLDCEPETCFVLEVNGQIVGYLVGCKNTKSFNRIFKRRYLPKIMARVGWRLLTLRYRKKSTYQMFWWTLIDRLRRRNQFEIDLDNYPAHSHMNIAPEYRARGISHLLAVPFNQHLKAHGVKGKHAVIIERAGEKYLEKVFCGSRGYRVAATQNYRLLEKLTKEAWQLKLLLYDYQQK